MTRRADDDSPTVTWLLPVHDAMAFLRATLESIAAQTYRRQQVLAWDDGSTDGSGDELRRWIGPRVPGRIIGGERVGVGAALAQLVEAADTELCARIDADDINVPDRLERQVAVMHEQPDAVAVGSNVSLMDERDQPIAGAWSMPCDDASVRWRLRFCNAMNHPTVMFRRSAVLRAGNYRPLQPGQDYDLWMRLTRLGRMINVAEPLVRYRRHAGSVSSTSDHRAARLRQARLATDNSRSLFPGIAPGDAMELRSVLVDERVDDVCLRHVSLLRRAAVEAARAAGQADDYFTRTAVYQQQHRFLMLARLKQHAVVRLAWPMLRLAGTPWRDAA